MRTFKTHDEHTWHIDLNLGIAYQLEQEREDFQELVKQIRPDLADCPVTLINMTDDEDQMKKYLEVITLTPVLLKLSWLCVREQSYHLLVPDLSIKPSIDGTPMMRPYCEDDYTAGFKGDTIIKVKSIMLQELADFFPQMGTLFSKLIEVLERSQSLVGTHLQKVLPGLDKEVDRYFQEREEALNKSLGAGVTSG